MGGIGRLLSFARRMRNGANVSDATADPGGGPNVTAEHFAAAGDDSRPLPGDFVLLVDVRQTGRTAAAGYIDPKNEQKALAGERRIYARDAAGIEVATVWVKNTGAVTITNENGSFELDPDGTAFINGAKITKDGDFVTSDGFSLRNHGHIGNLGSPTSKPI